MLYIVPPPGQATFPGVVADALIVTIWGVVALLSKVNDGITDAPVF